MPRDIYFAYIAADKRRLKSLTNALEAYGWQEPTLNHGKTWRAWMDELTRMQPYAVVHVWSHATNDFPFGPMPSLWSPAPKFLSVRLDNDARIPNGYEAAPAFDLVDWQGDTSSAEFQRLREHLEDIFEHSFDEVAKTQRVLPILQPLKLRPKSADS